MTWAREACFIENRILRCKDAIEGIVGTTCPAMDQLGREVVKYPFNYSKNSRVKDEDGNDCK